ncbi:hypothetical protein V5O48_004556 [Marasmius crinis-equi]|uniref:Uncharacterized protein n=1 Tax=Marasmius crinis-equi TaxID=585013 RepID=A0ABR3FPS8_9AGAR
MQPGYGLRVRTRALKIVMAHISGMNFGSLAEAVVHLNSWSKFRQHLSTVVACLQYGWKKAGGVDTEYELSLFFSTLTIKANQKTPSSDYYAAGYTAYVFHSRTEIPNPDPIILYFALIASLGSREHSRIIYDLVFPTSTSPPYVPSQLLRRLLYMRIEMDQNHMDSQGAARAIHAGLSNSISVPPSSYPDTHASRVLADAVCIMARHMTCQDINHSENSPAAITPGTSTMADERAEDALYAHGKDGEARFGIKGFPLNPNMFLDVYPTTKSPISPGNHLYWEDTVKILRGVYRFPRQPSSRNKKQQSEKDQRPGLQYPLHSVIGIKKPSRSVQALPGHNPPDQQRIICIGIPRQNDDSEWLALDLGNDHAYKSFLRVLHLYAPHSVYSSFVASLYSMSHQHSDTRTRAYSSPKEQEH